MQCLEVCAHANKSRYHGREHIQTQLPAAAATEKLAVEPAFTTMYVMDNLCCNLSTCQLAELNRQQSRQLSSKFQHGMTAACSALLWFVCYTNASRVTPCNVGEGDHWQRWSNVKFANPWTQTATVKVSSVNSNNGLIWHSNSDWFVLSLWLYPKLMSTWQVSLHQVLVYKHVTSKFEFELASQWSSTHGYSY